MVRENRKNAVDLMIKPDRYLALDVLRGMTIALMILVNTPGSWRQVWAPLRHAGWHGCTPADLVFPFFLFVAGVSLFFSLQTSEGMSRKALCLKAFRRTALIFALGLFLNTFPQWLTDYSQLRILGVLQRIALAYGLAAFLILAAPGRWLAPIGALILLVYWGLLWVGGGTDPYSLEQNAVVLLDRALLGEAHLYQGFGLPFDPEGLLSSMPAAVTVLIGYLAGGLTRRPQPEGVLIRLCVSGAALTGAGYLWGVVFPINKPLWTSSYVLYTAGLALLVFALLIWIIDLRGVKRWTLIFSVFGVNPLFLFLLAGMWGRASNKLIFVTDAKGETVTFAAWLYHHLFVPLAGDSTGSFLYALAHVCLFWAVGFALYRRRIFIKV